MDQKFKFEHHTVTYHGGGRYTLRADKGYMLQKGNNQPVADVETTDYTHWIAVEAPSANRRTKAIREQKSKPQGKK